MDKKLFSNYIGIDLGTANTLIFIKGKGIILREPSIVSIDMKENKIICIGEKSNNYINKNGENIISISPLKDGAISDFDITTSMLKDFIKKVTQNNILKKTKVIISIPSGITELEKRAVKESIVRCGAKSIDIIESPIAAAIGAGVEVLNSDSTMIIDIGGGTIEVAVISLGEILTYSSDKIAGNKLDYNIINYIRNKYNVLIGKKVAETIKIKIGSVYNYDDNLSMTVKGINLNTNLPQIITIYSDEIREALKETLIKIINLIKLTLEKLSDEVLSDINKNGIILTGGTSLLKGISKLISDEVNIPVYICENPFDSVISGTGKIIENMKELHSVLYNNDNKSL